MNTSFAGACSFSLAISSFKAWVSRFWSLVWFTASFTLVRYALSRFAGYSETQQIHGGYTSRLQNCLAPNFFHQVGICEGRQQYIGVCNVHPSFLQSAKDLKTSFSFKSDSGTGSTKGGGAHGEHWHG